ncbi:unnamed protein product (mitochondrion) [Plasmodiophora brassicae]|uniref:Uncharacterized protein n=1 Tax=Plasmodiophora brassicae TaxID=37360 RepID=A0A3P3Y0F0_PLABS|nr:unnamed protein product [Plasmodiophora brassicae]
MSKSGPAVFFNAKQLREAEMEAQDIIIYRHHPDAIERLRQLEEQLLDDSAPTATQSALYVAGDVLKHVANCVSDVKEIQRLTRALDLLQYRLSALSHAVDNGAGIFLIAVCSEPDAVVPETSELAPAEITLRLRGIFAELKRFLVARIAIKDVCNILETMSRTSVKPSVVSGEPTQ